MFIRLYISDSHLFKMGTKDDEMMRKFSRTFRKAMLENRENSNVVTPSKATPDRSVKFSSHTMETSLGGTHSLGRVKFNDSALSSMSLNSSCTSTVSLASSEDTPVKGKGTFAVPARPEDNSNYVTPVKQMKVQMLQTLQEEATPDCYRTVSLETPRPKGRVSVANEKDNSEDTCSVTVAVRCRPFSQR